MSRGIPILARLVALLFLLPLTVVWAHQKDWTSRVFKVEVIRHDGVREIGSAVSLGNERLATNCHVLRGAARIEVRVDGGMRQAKADARDAYRDLCLLTLPGFAAKPMPMIDVGQTRVGLDVVAVGYPGGLLAVNTGRIVGLHTCECDGGKVIQTSAAFERGASGGGLFDQQGRLVGILTFKAQSGGNFHFALPVGWLRHMVKREMDQIMGENASFWESPGKESGYFLAACDLNAKKNWRSLARLADDWTGQEPHNPEAWMALGRARLSLGQREAAAAAFQHVLVLDSTHEEAKWALQQLEFELGRSLMDLGGV